MKCDVCMELLEEYFDGELVERESSEVATHLMTCSACSSEGASLAAEEEMFSRYDRELDVSPFLWERIAQETTALVVVPVLKESLATRLGNLFRIPAFRFSLAAVALVVVALLVGAVYMQSPKSANTDETAEKQQPPKTIENDQAKPKQDEQTPIAPSHVADSSNSKKRIKKSPVIRQSFINQSDVVSTDLGYQDLDDLDTAKHLERTENLLRSIRNVQLNDNDQEIDMTYDKALSRRLLNENIVLRRDAEMRAKFPAKTLLSDLEPFLIDIANLPDQAKPEDVRAIKERVQKTEIVAALIGYDD
jgi:hypothetical protein